MPSLSAVLSDLKALPRKADGDIYDPDIKKIAGRIGVDHALALKLWATEEVPAQSLAIYIVDPDQADEKLLDRWVRGLNEWGVCDGFAARLVRPKKFAIAKAREWARRKPEFERRAGFSLLAQIAWQANAHKDRAFIEFLPLVEKHAADDRYYVKKAVNWALRDIGKRNASLQKRALATARRLKLSDDKTARWVGTHRMKEVEHANFRD